MTHRFFGLVLTSIFAAACGGSEPQPATPTAPVAVPTAAPAETAAPATAIPMSFREAKTKDQQMAFMKARIDPPMRKTFQAHDGNHFKDFSCKTCHGPNYVEPKEFLPKLTLKNGNITSFAEKPEVSKFMAEKVVPEMAAAMGEKPYDPATHQGFGCGGCHAIEMK